MFAILKQNQVPKLCLRVLIFAILIWSQNSPNKSLANINEFTVCMLQVNCDTYGCENQPEAE